MEDQVAPWMAWVLVQEGRVQLVDVRERDELDLPRVPGSLAIPLNELHHELATLDRERPVVFLSGRGRKAAAAMKVLRAAGMTAGAVEGGMRAWLQAGLPVEGSGDGGEAGLFASRRQGDDHTQPPGAHLPDRQQRHVE